MDVNGVFNDLHAYAGPGDSQVRPKETSCVGCAVAVRMGIAHRSDWIQHRDLDESSPAMRQFDC